MKPVYVVLIVAGEIVLALLAYGAGAGTGYFVGRAQGGSVSAPESYDVAPEATRTLLVDDHRFGALSVVAGELTEVVVTNADDTFHTFTYDARGSTFHHALQPGATSRVLVRFDAPQTIEIRCEPHDGMRGALVVEGASA